MNGDDFVRPPRRRRKTRITKQTSLFGFLTLLIASLFSVFVMSPQVTYASATPLANGCGFSTLGGWDWPNWTAAASTRSGTVTAGGVPNFAASSWSWMIVGQGNQVAHTSGGATTQATAFTMFVASGGNSDKIVAYMDSSGNEHITTANGSGLWQENVSDSSNPAVHITSIPSVMASNNSPTSDVQLNGTSGYVSSSSFPGGQCVAMSSNIIYASTWTDPRYSVGGAWTAGVGGPSAISCSGLNDIVCIVHNAFAGVADDFLAGTQALATFIARIFTPDGQQLSSDWTSFYSTLQTKLGFLLWPFSFVSGLFTAVVTPTTMCCTIGAGTFMGASWPGINLTYFQTVDPTVWSYMTDVIRGMTILLLLFSLRSKFLEITHK